MHVGIIHSRNAVSSSFLLLSVPLSGQMFCGKVVLVVTPDVMSVNYGIAANLHMKRKDTVRLLPDKFSPAKQEGAYVILKLYPADAEKFYGKGRKQWFL